MGEVTPRLRFSQRKGYKPVSQVIQREGMSADLRNSLWNVLDTLWNALNTYSRESEARDFTIDLWRDYYKEPLDTIPSVGYGMSPFEPVRALIRKHYFRDEWYEVYDFLEFVLSYFSDSGIVERVNSVLERELSGYRFVGVVITDITDAQEIEAIESALEDDDFPGVRAHLQRALELLSDRDNPDYRNSIKESISAVESMAQTILNKPNASLGDALLQIEKQGKLPIHKALNGSFRMLYGYTSDADGIRHGMLDEPNLSAGDAKYFLVSCSAFINYLKSKM